MPSSSPPPHAPASSLPSALWKPSATPTQRKNTATSLYEEEKRTHHQEEWLLVHRLNQGNCRREYAGPHPCRDTRKPQRGTSTDSGRKPSLALREVNLSFRSVSLCRRWPIGQSSSYFSKYSRKNPTVA